MAAQERLVAMQEKLTLTHETLAAEQDMLAETQEVQWTKPGSVVGVSYGGSVSQDQRQTRAHHWTLDLPLMATWRTLEESRVEDGKRLQSCEVPKSSEVAKRRKSRFESQADSP